MEAAREAKRAEVENVMIRKNQKIVDEGEIITQEIYDRLQSLGLIHSADYQNSALPLLGSLLLAGAVDLVHCGNAIFREQQPLCPSHAFICRKLSSAEHNG